MPQVRAFSENEYQACSGGSPRTIGMAGPVSGYDFSRAINATKKKRALAPEGFCSFCATTFGLGWAFRRVSLIFIFRKCYKTRVDFAAFTARVKSCPDTKPEFFDKFIVS
jgi:hypothetical protein